MGLTAAFEVTDPIERAVSRKVPIKAGKIPPSVMALRGAEKRNSGGFSDLRVSVEIREKADVQSCPAAVVRQRVLVAAEPPLQARLRAVVQRDYPEWYEEFMDGA